MIQKSSSTTKGAARGGGAPVGKKARLSNEEDKNKLDLSKIREEFALAVVQGQMENSFGRRRKKISQICVLTLLVDVLRRHLRFT